MMRKVGVFIAILVAVWVALRSQTGSPDGASSSASASSSAATPATDPSLSPSERTAAARVAAERAVGFRSRDLLHEHYQKHGREFGVTAVDDYLALAQKLRDAPTGPDVLEVVRPADGVISRFDKVSGAFLAADADGTIRTFFKPNDGEEYFRRQAKRRPSP